MSIRDYLFDVAKIIEGATNSDQEKVAAYAKQLADRLEAEGEIEGAKRIRNTVGKKSARTVGISRAGMGTHRDTDWHLPVDGESRLPTADEESYERGQVALIVSDAIKTEIDQFLIYYRAASQLIANGVGVSPTMLVYGPPGCGKTQLAKYIASELQLPIITARVDSLVSSYLGSTAKNLRQLFSYAMSHPCILFLDEFDALAKMRDDAKELGELKRVVIGLLQNIDSMGQDHVLIAATNHEHLLDPAIWRRFAYKIRLAEPDEVTRRLMVRQFLSRFATRELEDAITWLGEGMSGAQLRQVIDDCIRDSVIRNETTVSVRSAVERMVAASPKGPGVGSTLQEQIRAVRKINPKKFTQGRLAEVFEISQATVSRHLK